MELRHLRYFKAVAELLNFSRAAEQLRVAQPALSRQVRDLEQELDAKLLERNRVRVSLTDAGRTFYAHTCKVLAQVDIAVASVHETSVGTSGEFIICNDWRLATPVVLETIAEYRTRHPRVELTLRDLHVHQQLTALRTRQAHLGFVVHPEIGSDHDLDSLSLLKSDLMVVVNSTHPLAKARTVRLADFAQERWIITEAKEAPGLREFVTQICRLSGFTPDFAATSHNIEGILGRVATGYGVGLWPEFLTARFSNNPLVRCLRSDCAPIELFAVWHRRDDSRLLQQFLEILRRRTAQNAA